MKYLNSILFVFSVFCSVSLFGQDTLSKDKVRDTIIPIICTFGNNINTNLNAYPSIPPMLADASNEANTLNLDADFHNNSNSITNHLIGSFLFKKEITDEVKNRTANYASKCLKYEDELKAGLTYKHHFKKTDFNLFVSYYHRNIRNLVAPKDAYLVAFYGNKQFEDKTADLSLLRFEDLMYNQYSVGFSKRFNRFYGGVNFSFLQGFLDQQLVNKSGSLYTAPLGEYLDLKYQLEFNQSREGASKFFGLNGVGFSTDLHVAYTAKKFTVTFDAQDLGFIKWNSKPVNYVGDTAFRFNGLEINLGNLISGNGATGLNIDTLIKTLGPKRTEKSYQTILPSTFQIIFSVPIKAGRVPVILNVGANTRILSKYYVYGFVKANFFVKYGIVASVSAGAGGYSLFNLGGEVAKNWKHFNLALGTANIIGLVAPKYYPGSSLYLRLGAKF